MPERLKNCKKCGAVMDNLATCPQCGWTRSGPKPRPMAEAEPRIKVEPHTSSVTDEVTMYLKELRVMLIKHRHGPGGEIMLPLEE